MSKEDKIQKRRERNIEVFNKTQEMIFDSGELFNEMKHSSDETKIETSDGYYSATRTWKKSEGDHETAVYLDHSRTIQKAMEIHETIKNDPSKRLCILNFASATTVGGGVKQGANAQEESICRLSTLYPCLHTTKVIIGYYERNQSAENKLYKNICVYTPDVTVFRADDKKMEILPKEKWFHTDVITCAAPNLRNEKFNRFNPDDIKEPGSFTEEEYLSALRNRISLIITTALKYKVTHIVLGAFGCGAFKNDPNVVASTFHDVLFGTKGDPIGSLLGFGSFFDEIHFAVHCNKYEEENYKAFFKMFGTMTNEGENIYSVAEVTHF